MNHSVLLSFSPLPSCSHSRDVQQAPWHTVGSGKAMVTDKAAVQWRRQNWHLDRWVSWELRSWEQEPSCIFFGGLGLASNYSEVGAHAKYPIRARNQNSPIQRCHFPGTTSQSSPSWCGLRTWGGTVSMVAFISCSGGNYLFCCYCCCFEKTGKWSDLLSKLEVDIKIQFLKAQHFSHSSSSNCLLYIKNIK